MHTFATLLFHSDLFVPRGVKKAFASALSCIMLLSEGKKAKDFVSLQKSLVQTANTIIIHFVTGNHPRMLHNREGVVDGGESGADCKISKRNERKFMQSEFSIQIRCTPFHPRTNNSTVVAEDETKAS